MGVHYRNLMMRSCIAAAEALAALSRAASVSAGSAVKVQLLRKRLCSFEVWGVGATSVLQRALRTTVVAGVSNIDGSCDGTACGSGALLWGEALRACGGSAISLVPERAVLALHVEA